MHRPSAARGPQHLRRSIFGAACLSLQPLLMNAISLPAIGYIFWKLGRKDFGQWVSSTAIIATVSVFCRRGLRGRFVRCVAHDPKAAPEAFADELGVRIILTLGAMMAAVLFAVLLHYSSIVIECTAVGALAMLFTTVGITIIDLLQGMERFSMMASVSMVSGLILTGFSVIA